MSSRHPNAYGNTGQASYHGSPLIDQHKFNQPQQQRIAQQPYYNGMGASARPNSSVGGVADLSPIRRSSMRRRQMSTGVRSAHNSRPASPDPRQTADYMETPWGPQYPSGHWVRYPNSAVPGGMPEQPPPAHRAVSAGNLYERGDMSNAHHLPQPDMVMMNGVNSVGDMPAPLIVDAYNNAAPAYQRGAPMTSDVLSGRAGGIQRNTAQFQTTQPFTSPHHAAAQRRSKSVERVIDNSQFASSNTPYVDRNNFSHNRQSLGEPVGNAMGSSSAAWFDPYATLPRLPHDHQQQYRFSTLPRFVPRDNPPQPASTSNLLIPQPHYHHHHHSANTVQPQIQSSPAMTDYANVAPSTNSPFIAELQNQVTELTRECSSMRSELDAVRERLASTMNSIRSFWSPELKKERQLRKEEGTRYSMLSEQFRLLQVDSQKRLVRIQELEQRLAQYEAGLIQQSQSGCPPWELEALRAERDRLLNEFQGTRKTVDDLEMRLERMNEQLAQRDDNIQRLLEMLNNRSTKEQAQTSAENELLQARLQEAYNRVRQLEAQLNDRSSDVARLQQEAANLTALANRHQSSQTASVEAQLRDSKIALLEREVKTVTDELNRLRIINQQLEKRTTSATSSTLGQTSAMAGTGYHEKEIELARSQEKVLKQRIEGLRIELATKETEVLSWKTKAETLENQMTDQIHHVGFLKDQIAAKESQQAVMQSELEAIQERLRERDSQLDKKTKIVQQITAERRKYEAESAELRDHVDIKEKKIAVLQKKVDSLEDMLRDKDGQLAVVRQRLSQLQTEHAASGSAIALLEQRLEDREKKLAVLSDELGSCEGDFKAEMAQLQTVNHDLKKRVESLQVEMEMTKTSLNLARDECESVKNMAGQQQERIRELDRQLASAQQSADKVRSESSVETRELQEHINRLSNDNERLNSEINRLRGEYDKANKLISETQGTLKIRDEKVRQLEKEIADALADVTKAKTAAEQRAENMAANESAAWKDREAKYVKEVTALKEAVEEKKKRIEELESALTEALSVHAQREVALSQDLTKFDHSLKQGKGLNDEVDRLRQRQQELSTEVNRLTAEIAERDRTIYDLRNEKNRQEEQILEMKQEALVAAICEKDANIALFELTNVQTGGRPNPKSNQQMTKLTKEKEDIQKQLKELGEQRSKLAQKHAQELAQRPAAPPSQLTQNPSTNTLDKFFPISHSSSTSSTGPLTMTVAGSGAGKQLPTPQQQYPPTPSSQNSSSLPAQTQQAQQQQQSLQQSQQQQLQNQNFSSQPLQNLQQLPQHSQPLHQQQQPQVSQASSFGFGRQSPSPSRVTDLSNNSGGGGFPKSNLGNNNINNNNANNMGGYGTGGGMMNPPNNLPMGMNNMSQNANNMGNDMGLMMTTGPVNMMQTGMQNYGQQNYNNMSTGYGMNNNMGNNAMGNMNSMNNPMGNNPMPNMANNMGNPMPNLNNNMGNNNNNMSNMNMYNAPANFSMGGGPMMAPDAPLQLTTSSAMGGGAPLQLTTANRASFSQSAPFQAQPQMSQPQGDPQFTIPGRRGPPPGPGSMNQGGGYGDGSQNNRRGQSNGNGGVWA